MSAPSADQVHDVPILQALGNRRSIRYFDESREVERWKVETMLQAARFSSCQGNINCTEAIVVRRDECDLWAERMRAVESDKQFWYAVAVIEGLILGIVAITFFALR